jgi:hypothetical protein
MDLPSTRMQVAVFLFARLPLTPSRFQASALVYTLDRSFLLKLESAPDTGLITYVPPVTNHWHMFTIESYIQGEVKMGQTRGWTLAEPGDEG